MENVVLSKDVFSKDAQDVSKFPMNREERRILRRLASKDPELADLLSDVLDKPAVKRTVDLKTRIKRLSDKSRAVRTFFTLLESEQTDAGILLKKSDDDESLINPCFTGLNLTLFFSAYIAAHLDVVCNDDSLRGYIDNYPVVNVETLPPMMPMQYETMVSTIKLYSILRECETTGKRDFLNRLGHTMFREAYKEVKNQRPTDKTFLLRETPGLTIYPSVVNMFFCAYYVASQGHKYFRVFCQTLEEAALFISPEYNKAVREERLDSLKSGRKLDFLENFKEALFETLPEYDYRMSELESKSKEDGDSKEASSFGCAFGNFAYNHSVYRGYEFYRRVRRMLLQPAISEFESKLKSLPNVEKVGMSLVKSNLDDDFAAYEKHYEEAKNAADKIRNSRGSYIYLAFQELMSLMEVRYLPDLFTLSIGDEIIERFEKAVNLFYSRYGGRRFTEQELLIFFFAMIYIDVVAENYLRVVDRNLRMDVGVDNYAIRYYDLKDKAEALDSELEQKNAEIEGLKRKLAQANQTVNSLTSQCEGLREDNRSLAKEVAQLQREQESFEQEKQRLHSKISSLEAELEEFYNQDSEDTETEATYEEMVEFLRGLDVGIYGGTVKWANRVREVFPSFRWLEYTNNAQTNIDYITSRDFVFINPRTIGHAISERVQREASKYCRVLHWSGGFEEFVKEMYIFAKKKLQEEQEALSK